MARRRHKRARKTLDHDQPVVPMTDLQRAAHRARDKQASQKKVDEIDKGLPTPEQFKRNVYGNRPIKDPDGPTTRFARRNLTSRNLERWLHAGKIDSREYQAGDNYRSDYEKIGLQPRVTSRYDGGGGGGRGFEPPLPDTAVQMDAWKRWRAARDSLGSPAACFDCLVIDDQLANEIDPSNDKLGAYTSRTWMLVVRLCLDRLVVFYGL